MSNRITVSIPQLLRPVSLRPLLPRFNDRPSPDARHPRRRCRGITTDTDGFQTAPAPPRHDRYQATIKNFDVVEGTAVGVAFVETESGTGGGGVDQADDYHTKIIDYGTNLVGVTGHSPRSEPSVGAGAAVGDAGQTKAGGLFKTYKTLRELNADALPFALSLLPSSTTSSELSLSGSTTKRSGIKEAILEAIEEKVPLVVAVGAVEMDGNESGASGLKQILHTLSEQSTTRLLGPSPSTSLILPHVSIQLGSTPTSTAFDPSTLRPGSIGLITTANPPDAIVDMIQKGGWGLSAMFVGYGPGTKAWEVVEWMLADDGSKVILLERPTEREELNLVNRSIEHYRSSRPENQKAKPIIFLDAGGDGVRPGLMSELQKALGSREPDEAPQTSTHEHALQQSSHTAAQIARVPNRKVLEVTGKDAQKFLKGLTSRDVEALGGGYSGVFNASGRVLYDIFIYPRASTSTTSATPSYLIDFPSATAPASESSALPDLASHFKRFVLRSKVRVKDVSAEWSVWNAWGGSLKASGDQTWKFGSGGSAEPDWNVSGPGLSEALRAGLGEGEVACWDLRAGWGPDGMGRRLLVSAENRPMAETFEEVDSSAYTLRRMTLGVPEGADEIVPESALPLEACMDVMGGIDFRKGCYVGQELTVRTYHTGHTRKRIMPIRFLPSGISSDGEQSLLPPAEPVSWTDLPSSRPRPAAGDAIMFLPPKSAPSQKAKAGVKILSVHPTCAVGLGLIRLEYAERCWGSSAHESRTGSSLDEDRGSLSTGQGVDAYNVWAGRGRAWYSAAELTAAQTRTNGE